MLHEVVVGDQCSKFESDLAKKLEKARISILYHK